MPSMQCHGPLVPRGPRGGKKYFYTNISLVTVALFALCLFKKMYFSFFDLTDKKFIVFLIALYYC